MKPENDTHVDWMTLGFLTAATQTPGTPLDLVGRADRVLRNQVDDDAWQAARTLCAGFAVASPSLVAGQPPGIVGYCLYWSQRGERGGFLSLVDARVASEPRGFETASELTPRETRTVWHHNRRMRAADTAAAAVPVLALAVTGGRGCHRIGLAGEQQVREVAR